MEQLTNEIRVGYSDPEINSLISSVSGEDAAFSRHFNHAEEFFIGLEKEFTVPRFPIHHDVRLSEPVPEYRSALASVIREISGIAPQIFRGLTYFFDPAETLRPSFFQVLRLEESRYLYLMRLDLAMKPSEGIVIARGDNDFTPRYRARSLFMEAVILPLDEVVVRDGMTEAFKVKQLVSQTWIGERGRGYFIQGIWMDADLTRFFSRLFLPKGRKTYPFFPFLCKYKTICRFMIDAAPEGRREAVPQLRRAIEFLAPAIERIQAALKDASFAEDLPVFAELKARVPEEWYDAFRTLKITGYLNAADMKEFLVEN